MTAHEHCAGEPEPIGKLLARLRLARGWSQMRIAEKLCDASSTPTVSRHEVSRWEREERIPGSFWLAWLAAVLEAPPEQMEAAVAVSRGQSEDQSSLLADQHRLWRPPTAADLQAALDHASCHDITGLAHAWLAGPANRSSNARDLASSCLPPPADQTTPEALDALEVRLAERRRQDDLVGGLDLAERVNRELHLAVEMLRMITNERMRLRALRLVAGYGHLAGWTLADAEDGLGARRAYLVALQAAAGARDGSLAAHVLGSLSHQSLDAGDPYEALLLARTAYAGVRHDGGPLTRALLLHRVALAAARAGERHEAGAALLAAEQAAERAEPGQEPDWLYWLDAGELSAMTGRCLAALGRPLRATQLLKDVSRRVGPGPRTTALYAIWLARCYVELGEVEQACRVSIAALADVLTAGSARAATGLRHLHPLLLRHRDVSAVQRYEQLADYVTGRLYRARPQRRGLPASSSSRRFSRRHPAAECL